MNKKSKAFLCHSSRDKDFVHIISNRLKKLEIDIWIDEVDIQIGESLIEKISQGIHESNVIVAFISASSVDSSWVQKELSLAMTREIQSKRVVVLPVLIEKCNLPYFLRDKLFADFRKQEAFNIEFEKLFRSIERFMLKEESVNNIDKSSDMPSEHRDIGKIDIGNIVHDRGQQYYGYKVVKSHKIMGLAIVAQGIIIGLLSIIPAFYLQFMAGATLLIFFGFWVTMGGSMLILAGYYFESSYDEDKKILLEIEAIGGYSLPFDKKWWLKYNLGKSNTKHRYGMIFETGSHVVFFLSILISIIRFLMIV